MRKLLLFLFLTVSLSAQVIPLAGADTVNFNTLNSNFSWLNLNKMRYLGAWSAGTTYGTQEMVSYAGVTYISIQAANLNHQPDASVPWWTSVGGGGGGGTVSSIFGRTGAIVAVGGDYTTAQVTEGVNLYFTNLRVLSAMAGLYEAPLTFTTPVTRSVNVISCPTCLVSTGSYSQPVWLTSVQGSIISGNITGTAGAHATSHQNGGADEIATATPGANAIPKAGAAGRLAIGFLASGTPDGTRFVSDAGTLLVPSTIGGATVSLDNLASVNINTSLVPQVGVDLGSVTKPFRDLYLFGGGTYGTNYFRFTGTPTGTRIITFPDSTGTVLYQARTVSTTTPLGGGGALTADLTLTCATCLVSTGSYSQPTWLTSVAGSIVSGNITGNAAAHAASHQNGGADEVATVTPAANAIPKAGAGGQLAIGFLASGTPDGTKFVRDDGTLAAVGGASGGTVTSVGLTGTTRQITVTGASPITGAGSWALTLPADLLFPSNVTYTAGTTSVPSFNVPSGVAPTAPTSGDFWNQGGILKFRDASITQSLLFHSRTISTTSPLGGGGALTSDLTLTCATCIVSTGSYSQPAWLTSILGSIVSGNITGNAANVTGIVGLANGGTGQATATAGFDALSPMTLLGDTIYGGTAGTRTRLAGNTTTTRQFLRQAGTGSVSAVPVWDTLLAADVPTLNQSTTGNAATATVATTANEGDSATAFFPSGTIEAARLPDLSATYQPTDADLTAIAALAATAGITARTGAGAFAVRTLTGTANQITVTNGDGSAGNPTLSIPTSPTLPGTTTGTFSGPLTGNASTATALAANGANCTAGQYPLGVDAAGAVEGCTAAGAGTVTSVGLVGTANQVTVTGASPITSTGSWTLTLPSGLIFPGTATFTAGTTSIPSFNIPSGVAKTSPASGDVWNQSGALKFYDGTRIQTVLTSNNDFSGMALMSGLTSGSSGFAANDIAGTAILYLMPVTNGTAGQQLIDSGTATCPTLEAGAPTVCHQLNWVTRTSKIWLPAATCQGTTGALNWDTAATLAPTAVCSAGTTATTMIRGTADFPDSDGLYALQSIIMLPSDWTGAIDAKFLWQSAATSGDVVWQATTSCIADAEVNDLSYNTPSKSAADAAKGTTLQTNTVTIAGLVATGCAAGELMHLKVMRDRTEAVVGDTITGVVSLIGVELTTRRTL